jgi:hypothetical protein
VLIVQVLQDSFLTPVSGAEWRAATIAERLLQSGQLRQLAVGAEDAADRPSIDTLNRLGRPDLVVIEGVGLIEAAETCRAAWPDVPLVIDFHNVESDLLRQLDMARLPGILRPVGAAVFRRRWAAAEALDRRACALADRIYTDTPPELLPAAARNVLAHLIALAERGRVTARPALAAEAVYTLS